MNIAKPELVSYLIFSSRYGTPTYSHKHSEMGAYLLDSLLNQLSCVENLEEEIPAYCLQPWMVLLFPYCWICVSIHD